MSPVRRAPSGRPGCSHAWSTASARTPSGAGGDTLAFVESPVQLLNVLEWAHLATDPRPGGPLERHTCQETGAPRTDAALGGRARADGPWGEGPPGDRDGPAPGVDAARERRTSPRAIGRAGHLTVVILPPHDPMTRGQLRRMAACARDEGLCVRWEEGRGGTGAALSTLSALSGPLRRARRVVIGDPFSRYLQLLLTLTRRDGELVVVDDGTATMEFVAQLARGERLSRWHGRGASGARALLYRPLSAWARRRLLPMAGRRRVEIFSSMPIDAPEGVTVVANEFAWTRARFGPPRVLPGTDLVGTSLVETGVVDLERYLAEVAALARGTGATRYFAHRRESAEKLRRLAELAGVEIVRPDLPLELVARRGPIARTVLSFPSTVVHTLPLALRGTEVRMAVCEVQPAWLTEHASPRAHGFLSTVIGTARGVHQLPS